jgi:hypothetical protein
MPQIIFMHLISSDFDGPTYSALHEVARARWLAYCGVGVKSKLRSFKQTLAKFQIHEVTKITKFLKGGR